MKEEHIMFLQQRQYCVHFILSLLTGFLFKKMKEAQMRSLFSSSYL